MAIRLRTTDRLFARFCCTGDSAALGRVFDRTAGHLLHVAAWLAGNRHDAEDMLQRTFLTAIEDRASFAAERSIMPWLVGILTNHARNLHRERARRAALPASADRIDDPAARAADRELLAAMVEARAALARPYCEVLELSLDHGLDAKQIAARLGRPAGTVRTQLVRALALLRQRLPKGFVAGFAPAGAQAGALATVKAQVLAAARDAAVPSAATAGVATTAVVSGGVVMAKKVAWVVPVFALLLGFAAYSAWPALQEQPAPSSSSAATASLDRPAPAVTADTTTTAERAPDRLPVAVPAAGEHDPGFASLRVLVRWQDDGSPAPNVGVSVFPKRGSQLLCRNATTDAGGVAVLQHITPSSYYLEATHVQGPPAVDVVADQQQTVELQAKRTYIVRGRVVDHEGAPVAGAGIHQVSSEWSNELGRSDASGRFAVPLLHNCELAARKAGHAPSYNRAVRVDVGKDLDIELTLRGKAGTVRGRVHDASGAGIAWATVLVGLRGGHVVPSGSPDIRLNMPRATRVLTGRDGEFEVDDVPAGKSELRAWAVGFGPTELTFAVPPGEVTEQAVTLTAGCTVTGVVRDAAGQPAMVGIVSGEEFAVFSVHATTAADGSFRLENLPAGNVRLSAGGAAAKATATLALRAGTTTEWNPVLGKGRTIAGTVFGPDDAPFAGVKVGAVHPNYQQVMNWIETDAAGRFELSNVGDKPAPLQVQKDRASLVETAKIAPGTRDVVIRVGARDLPTARLRGRIVDTLGRPIPGSVFLRRRHITNGDSYQLDQATGGFAFGPMPASSYEVSARAEGFGDVALGTIMLEPGQERVLDDVVLQEPGAVELTVFDAAGKPADAVGGRPSSIRTENGVGMQGCEIRRGKGTLAVLQPGRYFFECSTGRAQMARGEFVVQSGTTTQVELHGNDVVQATVRFRDHEPTNPSLSVTLLVRTSEGRFAAFAATYPQNPEPLAQRLSLPIGTYRLDCRASDGRRIAAELAVRSRDDRPELTIDLPRR